MESVPYVLVIADWTDVPVPQGLLTAGEQALAARLPAWRAREFTAGRLAARAAAVMAGRPAAEILRARDGAPVVVPVTGGEPCALSIAHTGSLAVAAAGPPSSPLGADIEPRDEGNAVLIPMISVAGDQVPPGTDPTLLFACKEAAYKAWRGLAPVLSGYQVRITGNVITATCHRVPCSTMYIRSLCVRLPRSRTTAVITVAGPAAAFTRELRVERLPGRELLSLLARKI